MVCLSPSETRLLNHMYLCLQIRGSYTSLLEPGLATEFRELCAKTNCLYRQ